MFSHHRATKMELTLLPASFLVISVSSVFLKVNDKENYHLLIIYFFLFAQPGEPLALPYSVITA